MKKSLQIVIVNFKKPKEICSQKMSSKKWNLFLLARLRRLRNGRENLKIKKTIPTTETLDHKLTTTIVKSRKRKTLTVACLAKKKTTISALKKSRWPLRKLQAN